MLTLETVVHRNPDVLTAEADEGLVMLLPDSNCYLVLNTTARAVWDGLAQPATGVVVSEKLANQYRVERDQLQASVLRTLQLFLDRGVAVGADAAAGSS